MVTIVELDVESFFLRSTSVGCLIAATAGGELITSVFFYFRSSFLRSNLDCFFFCLSCHQFVFSCKTVIARK